ncbi:hypothetical protein FGG08_005661 [Glutinoglossum americanum]|uniref:Amino acid permease/ SLC12A domain-containing protein n=1 Tax=Glutinoglossum americanum TaxID=1670608 RepID=A0A9P8I527_9PEZI|nr:hypothetical protein FGG08_005661 [Glutinoglossum americanum]
MADGMLYRSRSDFEIPEMRGSQVGDEQVSQGRRTLDQCLKRHHITGIAFSGAVGVGIYQSSGEIIALGGPVGALIAFVFAGLVVISVMRSLAEMASVRPVTGALMDYPSVFVDEALGFAVGIAYWLANCMSLVTLTITVAQMSQYWKRDLNTGWIIFAQLTIILILNGLGVQASFDRAVEDSIHRLT